MFTIDQIQAAHSKVKSGADFPVYIQDLIALGVTKYDTFVIDGHSLFYGNDGYKVESNPKYGGLSVLSSSKQEQFVNRLKLHQQGGTDYSTFCQDAADNGVEKWTVDTASMTCNYFDKSGNLILAEKIPA